ncbi:MAG TPA: dTDP-4-dehydrorhamnose 3,5-epimerase family protein, partial [Burkholderiales bacterium]|nr:dTDP-4-dehydrorhamnose 3,5-epimerase family protein [Burkholderiales bacterium]
MKIAALDIQGAALIEAEPAGDERGLFARTFCRDEFMRAGLPGEFLQCSTSFNVRKGTLRGMHFQARPHEEGRLVRCTRGAIHDVVLDLRRDSRSYRKWLAFELSADNRRALYIPHGCAHGFQTLADASEV